MTTNRDFIYPNDYRQQIPLPNSTLILILGIISIPLSCCYAIPGLICSIIALVLARNENRAYEEKPMMYTESSYANMKTGRTCAMIALIFAIIAFVFILIMVIIFGASVLTDPSIIQNYGTGLPS
jgi:hypothetical protein